MIGDEHKLMCQTTRETWTWDSGTISKVNKHSLDPLSERWIVKLSKCPCKKMVLMIFPLLQSLGSPRQKNMSNVK